MSVRMVSVRKDGIYPPIRPSRKASNPRVEEREVPVILQGALVPLPRLRVGVRVVRDLISQDEPFRQTLMMPSSLTKPIVRRMPKAFVVRAAMRTCVSPNLRICGLCPIPRFCVSVA